MTDAATTMGRDFTADDAWSFNEGTHTAVHEVLGAHVGSAGVTFRVWAPAAQRVDSGKA